MNATAAQKKSRKAPSGPYKFLNKKTLDEYRENFNRPTRKSSG
jgi:hypothetical protein